MLGKTLSKDARAAQPKGQGTSEPAPMREAAPVKDPARTDDAVRAFHTAAVDALLAWCQDYYAVL